MQLVGGLRVFVAIAAISFLKIQAAMAIVDENGQGSKDGLVALYLFNESTGNVVMDRSGYLAPLNLVIQNTVSDSNPRYLWLGQKGLALGAAAVPTGRVKLTGFTPFDLFPSQTFANLTNPAAVTTDYIQNNRVIVTSQTPATKIVEACRTSEEMTVQMITRNYSGLNRDGRMFALSRVASPRFNAVAETTSIPGTTQYNPQFTFSNAADLVTLNQDYSGNMMNANGTITRQLNGATRVETVRTQINFVDFVNFSNATTFQAPPKHEYILSYMRNGDVHYYMDRVRHRKVTAVDPVLSRNTLSGAWAAPTAVDPKTNTYLVLGDRLIDRNYTPELLATTIANMKKVDASVLERYNRKLSVDTSAWFRPRTLLGTTTANPKFRAGMDDNENLRAAEILDLISARGWSGEIYMLAVYCKGYSPEDILGQSAPSIHLKESIKAVDAGEPSENRKIAKKIFEKVTGTKIPLDHPTLNEMESMIGAGQKLEAAKLATQNPEFLNLRVKEMALKMSNREESSRVNLNDFAASFMGVTRDQTDARELLYGDFLYLADSSKAAVPSNMVQDLLRTNRHFEFLGSGEFDIGASLKRLDGQMILTGNLQVAAKHPDPAGVITSRAFMSAHANAGTNRRPVEYLFREFMCLPLETWADTSAPESHVGGDVDRFPAGVHDKYLNTCRGCHSVMDGFRGAFAKVDYRGSFTLHTDLVKDKAILPQDQYGTVEKMNINNATFPLGKIVKDDTFVNNAMSVRNKALFGWRGDTIYGRGLSDLGRMVASSRRFSLCMAKRVFESTCQKKVAESELESSMKTFADQFESQNYNLKALFQEVAASDSCLKSGGGK